MIIACVAGELFWLISAPLPRYGIVYMLFLMCVAIGILFREGQKSISDGLKRYTLKCSKVGGIGFCFVILFYSLFYAPYSYISQWGEQTVIWQNDYADRDTIKEEINGKEVFRAAQGDQTGYAPFPSTPYLGAIEGIELRGENFDNGFRCK